MLKRSQVKSLILFSTLLTPNTGLLAEQSLDVMFYNAENLFDAKHDFDSHGEEKDDWTFLPSNFPKKKQHCLEVSNKRYRDECLKTNWTQESFTQKLEQIKKVISHNGPNRIPDLLGMCEVENRNAIENLVQTISDPNIAYVMTDSPDHRGIDVALIYKKSDKLKFIKFTEHELSGPTFKNKPTRNILEAEFTVFDQQKLVVYVNHWPSQNTKSPEPRLEAARKLRSLMEKQKTETPGVFLLAMGDFNTLPKDNPNPFTTELLKNNSKLNVLDIAKEFSDSEDVPYELKDRLPPGTHFYPPDMSWNTLDRFFISSNLLNTQKDIFIDLKTYEIVREAFMKEDFTYNRPDDYLYGTVVKGVPMRMKVKESGDVSGFSDHFPISFTLIYR